MLLLAHGGEITANATKGRGPILTAKGACDLLLNARPCASPAQPGYWTQPSTTPSPSLTEGVFTVTHPFHPLYGQQFEILSYRCCWGEYRVSFYETADHVRTLPAAWTSLAPPDPSVVLATGRAAFRVVDLLELSHLIRCI